MIVTNKKSEYKNIEKVNGGYTVNFGYKPIVEYLPTMVNGELVVSDVATDTDDATWVSIFVDHKPSIVEVKSIINGYYNKLTSDKIVNDLVWNGYNVPLSSNDQANYKAICDLAVQTEGASLPVIVKLNNGIKDVYYTFSEVSDIVDFWTACVKHINNCLAEGWKIKEKINFDNYKN